MIEVALFTKSNKYVHAIVMPAFQIMPEGIMWGSRYFRLEPDGVYREGMLWTDAVGLTTMPEPDHTPTADQLDP